MHKHSWTPDEPEEQMSRTRIGPFLPLWIVASVVGGSLMLLGMELAEQSPIVIAASMVLIGLLQALVALRSGLIPDGRRWMAASVAAWLMCVVVFAVLPWHRFEEAAWELWFLGGLLVANLLTGALQAWLLRAQTRFAPLWAIVPLVSLVAAFVATQMTFSAMLATLSYPSGTVFLVANAVSLLIFGLIYGLITGSGLFALLRREQRAMIA